MISPQINSKLSHQLKKSKQPQISSPFKFKFVVPVNSMAYNSSKNKLQNISTIKTTNNTICDYPSSTNNSCSSKQQLFLNFLSQRDTSDKKGNNSLIKRIKYTFSSSKKKKQDTTDHSNQNESIGTKRNNVYLRKLLKKKNEEIVKLKEEIKYYKNRSIIRNKHNQRESNSFDVGASIKQKQFNPPNEDVVSKRNSTHNNKQFFIYPNKMFITHMKSAKKLKSKYSGLNKKNKSQCYVDESYEDKNKTEYTYENNDINKNYVSIREKQKIFMQKSFEDIKKRMRNILWNIKEHNTGKEIHT